jgi:hypothetical protein
MTRDDIIRMAREAAADRDRYKAMAGELAWALKRIAYTQQDISTPPIMSEAESMRRQATAALAAYEKEVR